MGARPDSKSGSDKGAGSTPASRTAPESPVFYTAGGRYSAGMGAAGVSACQ